MTESKSDKRPKFSIKFCVDVALSQSFETLCPWCKQSLDPGQPRVLEHWTPRKMLRNPSDADKLGNMRYLHTPCAKEKTIGRRGTSTKGSVADGDTHRIAKMKRLEKKRLTPEEGGLFHAALRGSVKLVARGQKIQSRGFDRTKTKGFDGSVRNRKPRLDRG